MQFDIYHRDIISHLFSTVDHANTFYSLLQLNKLFYQVGKELIQLKRKQFSRFIRYGNKEYYLLPNGKKDGSYIKRLKIEGLRKGLVRYYGEVDNKIYREYNCINGLVQGPYYHLHENGNVFIECNYVDGKIDGYYYEWYSSGNLGILGYYIDGKQEGDSYQWYENGQLKLHYHFHNDKLHGLCREWHQNGRLSLKCNYINNSIKELYLEWDINGDPIKILLF